MQSVLIDAVRRAQESADFKIPSDNKVDALKEDDLVKIGMDSIGGGERFWVVIEDILPGGYRGKIDNNLLGNWGVNRGDSIMFERRHIIDIYGD
jgi:hypothetical protein